MKKVLYTLAVILLAAYPPDGQILAGQGLAALELQAPQEANRQSPEALEVKRLNAEVVRLFTEGKFDEAIPLAKRALKLSEKEFGSNHQMVAEARSNLAELYIGKQAYDEAEANHKRTLSIYEKALGENHLLVGKTLDRLALISFVKRDFEKAEQMYQRALAIKEKAFGAEHAEVLQSLVNLTEVYRRTRERSKANSLYPRILAVQEKTFGQSHPKVAEVLERFACSLYSDGEQSEALKMEARANSILYKEAVKKGEPIAPPAEVFDCKVISNPHPKMPEAAISMRWTGETTLRVAVVVDETGKATSAQLISGDKLFKETAEKAALNARFRPTLVDGQPVKVKGEVVYGFLTKSRMVAVPGIIP